MPLRGDAIGHLGGDVARHADNLGVVGVASARTRDSIAKVKSRDDASELHDSAGGAVRRFRGERMVIKDVPSM